MTRTNRGTPHSTTASVNRARRAAVGSVRQARIQRVFDGVVASYIRDISVRTAPAPVHD
jgi:uncharacterized DUF497 family protein